MNEIVQTEKTIYTLKYYARVCKKVQAVLAANGMRQAWPAAIEVGVSPKTVADHLNRGTIPGVQIDSRWMVPQGAIEAALAAGVFTVGRGKYIRKPKKAKSKPQAGDGAQA